MTVWHVSRACSLTLYNIYNPLGFYSYNYNYSYSCSNWSGLMRLTPLWEQNEAHGAELTSYFSFYTPDLGQQQECYTPRRHAAACGVHSSFGTQPLKVCRFMSTCRGHQAARLVSCGATPAVSVTSHSTPPTTTSSHSALTSPSRWAPCTAAASIAGESCQAMYYAAMIL